MRWSLEKADWSLLTLGQHSSGTGQHGRLHTVPPKVKGAVCAMELIPTCSQSALDYFLPVNFAFDFDTRFQSEFAKIMFQMHN
jgi:hypothetical protein